MTTDKPPQEEQDARWTVTGTAQDGTLWKRQGQGFEALQTVLREARDSGVQGIKTTAR